MDKEELLKIFDQEQRIDIDFPDTPREVCRGVIRSLPPGEMGFIGYSDLDETTADAAIDEQVNYFKNLNLGFEWKVYDHDRPADLRERLKARGFEIQEPEALMVLDLDNAPEWYWTVDTSQVRPITDANGVRCLIEVKASMKEDDLEWLADRLSRDLHDNPELLSVFASEEDEQWVSGAWIYYHPPSRFASLWGGSTLPAYRKRGHYTALLAARAREARQRGFRFLTVDASPMSRPILEKHGFQFLGYSTPCEWKPADQGEQED